MNPSAGSNQRFRPFSASLALGLPMKLIPVLFQILAVDLGQVNRHSEREKFIGELI